MRESVPEQIVRLRLLAEKMRTHAAETSMDLYRCQFQQLAGELEQRARDLEGRDWASGDWEGRVGKPREAWKYPDPGKDRVRPH